MNSNMADTDVVDVVNGSETPDELFDKLHLCGEPHTHVTCRECGKRYKTIEHSHLKHKHGMSINEYEYKYPDVERICTRTLIKLGRFDDVLERLEL